MSDVLLSEIQKLEPSAIIELFVLDATNEGGGLTYFHSGTNQLNQDIVWQSQTYIRYPIQVTGFEFSGAGTLPRPRLIVSNFMSGITTLLMAYNDLIGSKITRKRTLKKYLDATNFLSGINPTEDPTIYFPDDIYFVDRKVNESRKFVEFELVSALDLTGVMIPRRQVIQNSCPWKYKGSECGYTGTSYFDSNDVTTSDPSKDSCSKRLEACKLRFGANNPLPFGGFPGADLFKGG